MLFDVAANLATVNGVVTGGPRASRELVLAPDPEPRFDAFDMMMTASEGGAGSVAEAPHFEVADRLLLNRCTMCLRLCSLCARVAASVSC